MSDNTLLLCTVGGSPEPIVAALKHWRPSRVLFVPSPQTRPDVEAKILPLAEQEGFPLGVGAYDCIIVPDSQDFAGCVRKMHELAPEVARWLARGPDFRVVVDYTGGTKSMSAALAVQAHPWGCSFAYVGGTERTKNDVGIVVSGKEQVLHVQNPWEALGYQAVEEATVLFDQGALAAASRLLDRALRQVQDPARKRELQGFKVLADAYDAWDRFDHRQGLNRLQEVQKFANDLVALLGRDRADRLSTQMAGHRGSLADLVANTGPTPARVKDLLANARRRAVEGRHDDAVARLYRAIEAIAQVRLREAHGIPDTGHVPPDRLPEPLARRWSNRVNNGSVFLGLRDDYTLLEELGDDLGREFQTLGLHDHQRSPLVSRNQSILAHGFDQVGEKVFQLLWDASLRLARLSEADLPAFPRLGPEARS